jgi:hypothetical protein
MRGSLTTLLTLLILLQGTNARADDPLDSTDPFVKSAKETWTKVEPSEPVLANTEHFLILGPKALETKLKEIGELFEKVHAEVAKTLFTGKNEVPFKAKLTVYLLPQEEQVPSFIRRVEKRRPLGKEKGSYSAEDGKLHVVAAVPSEKSDPPIEVQAAQQVASLLLQRKAGVRTILPYWLVSGFGRATYYRVVDPKDRTVSTERQNATRFIRTTKHNAATVWNGLLEGEEQTALEPSLAYFLAYGPARMKFLAMLAGFAPAENEEKKTVEQALQAAELKEDVINKKFREWVLRPD